jgi:hypothetical protein
VHVSRKHPVNLPDEAAQAMCRPRGTLTFKYSFDQLFDRSAGSGVLLEVLVGRTVCRLWRDEDLNLHFLHSSPGAGTRVATVSLEKLRQAPTIGAALVWSPEETRLHVLDTDDPTSMVAAVGEPTGTEVKPGADGSVFELGSPGVDVMGARVFEGGTEVLGPTALQVWSETLQAAEILLGGSSESGFMFEVVQGNSILVMASTGFETYCEKRFAELEAEGVAPDEERLAVKFLSRRERQSGLLTDFTEEARAKGVSFAARLAQERIDFGNYEDSRRAFAAGYGLRFGVELDVSNTLLEQIQQTIKFRHRIVHVSPLLAFLNQAMSPPDDPIFSNRELAESTLRAFDEFVRALHQATLQLDRTD